MGAMGVGATIYFGSGESRRQIQEVSELFHQAHELGMFTVLWCYLRNAAFKTPEADYHTAADLTGQANHLGVTIEADVIKQKLPETNGGYPALGFGKTHGRVYEALTTEHPIDLTRYQVANCYLGRGRAHQLGRGLVGRERPEGGGEDRGRQQAGGRHRAHFRPQGVPAPDGGGRRPSERDPGRLPVPRDHRRLNPARRPLHARSGRAQRSSRIESRKYFFRSATTRSA